MIGKTNAIESYLKYKFGFQLTYKIFNNVKWVKIYYHDVSSGYWQNIENVMKYTLLQKQFSLLGLLDDLTYQPGIYEFMLEYPGITGYNRWSQTSNPCNSTSVTGFQAISLTWTSYFGGLRKVNTSSTWLQGDTSTSWFWAICSHTSWNNGIPLDHNAGSSTTKAELWLRCE